MTAKTPVVWTEKNNCQDCYRCLRECTVKAIKIEDASASIINELCISCGHCAQICPSGAKKTRNDVPDVLKLLRSGKKVILSLAPSYISEFPDISTSQLISAIKTAGFFGVSETALGAEKAAAESKKWLDNQPLGVFIGSSCPSAVEYIGKYFPQYTSMIAPVHSPMVCHGTMLKAYYGNDVHVVFAGPCFAKKTESDLYGDRVDYAITFIGLKKLLDSFGIDPQFCEPTNDDVFIPHSSKIGDLFPIDGGMLMNMRNDTSATDIAYMGFSGIHEIRNIMRDIEHLQVNRKLFLELMICDGGCIQGPARLNSRSVASKRLKVIANNAEKIQTPHIEEFDKIAGNIDTSRSFDYIQIPVTEVFSDEDIKQSLANLNKFSERDELNCGGCGYEDCRTFAAALLSGVAERQMCVAYMRGVANDKASVLLQKIPSGVVMVDDDLRIVDCNAKFAELCGEEIEQIYDADPGMHGADLRKIIHSHKFFSTVLETGIDIVEQDIRDEGLFYNLSVITIQKHKLVLGLVQNMREPQVQKELVLNRTRDVILENMKVVQKIAYLLGENASYTETMLNSILESHDNHPSV